MTTYSYPPPTPTPEVTTSHPDSTGYLDHNGLAIHLNPNMPDGETLTAETPHAAFQRWPHGRILIVGTRPRPWAHHAVHALIRQHHTALCADLGIRTGPDTALHVLCRLGMDPDRARDAIADAQTWRPTFAADGAPLGVEPIPPDVLEARRPRTRPADPDNEPGGTSIRNVTIHTDGGTMTGPTAPTPPGAHVWHPPATCPTCGITWVTGTPPQLIGTHTLTCHACNTTWPPPPPTPETAAHTSTDA